jgi:hypothetical protein
VPAGTTLYALAERPIERRSGQAGDSVFLQLAHPVLVHDTVVIPAGTYVEGVLDGLSRPGLTLHAEMRLRLARIVYNNGYVVVTTAPARGLARDGGVRNEPPAALAAVFMAVLAASTTAGSVRGNVGAGGVIGMAAGAVATMVAGLVLSRGVAVEEGAPVDLVLQRPLVLDARRATAPGTLTFLPPPHAPPHRGLCYIPGTPGTPGTIIPGSPGTPPVGDSPGTPPTPPTIVPGVPGTPDSWVPCDR